MECKKTRQIIRMAMMSGGRRRVIRLYLKFCLWKVIIRRYLNRKPCHLYLVREPPQQAQGQDQSPFRGAQ
jgi:hypothetical protein